MEQHFFLQQYISFVMVPLILMSILSYVVHDFSHLLFLGVILHGLEVIQGINRGLKLVSMVLTSVVVIRNKNDIYMKFAVHSP